MRTEIYYVPHLYSPYIYAPHNVLRDASSTRLTIPYHRSNRISIFYYRFSIYILCFSIKNRFFGLSTTSFPCQSKSNKHPSCLVACLPHRYKEGCCVFTFAFVVVYSSVSLLHGYDQPVSRGLDHIAVKGQRRAVIRICLDMHRVCHDL